LDNKHILLAVRHRQNQLLFIYPFVWGTVKAILRVNLLLNSGQYENELGLLVSGRIISGLFLPEINAIVLTLWHVSYFLKSTRTKFPMFY